MSDLEEFGPFSTAFGPEGIGVPGYLSLLNLADDRAQIVIDRIERALEIGDPNPWLAALLADVNWRPHLVAAVALLLHGGQTPDCNALWAAIDAGSWVTPQLVATAYYIDGKFAHRATERIDALCPVNFPGNLGDIERHSATGPAGVQARNAKMLASLLSFCRSVPALARREQRWRNDPQIQKLLKVDDDFDGSGGIAQGWMSAVRDHFERRGVTLSPPGPLRSGAWNGPPGATSD